MEFLSKLMKNLENNKTLLFIKLSVYKLYPSIVSHGEYRISLLEKNPKDIFLNDFFELYNIRQINYKKLLEYIFPSCEVVDCQSACFTQNGHPDFKLIHNGEEFYIEIKYGGDTLKWNQFDWIKNKKRFYCIRIHEIADSYRPMIYKQGIKEKEELLAKVIAEKEAIHSSNPEPEVDRDMNPTPKEEDEYIKKLDDSFFY